MSDKPKTFLVTPVRGRRVRDPVSGEVLSEEGAEVTWSEFWERRRLDGDIHVAEPKPDDTETAPPPPPPPAKPRA